jgi:hypothetical protein
MVDPRSNVYSKLVVYIWMDKTVLLLFVIINIIICYTLLSLP